MLVPFFQGAPCGAPGQPRGLLHQVWYG